MAHGDHWEAITGDAESAFTQMIPVVISEGKLIGTSRDFLFQHEDGQQVPERISGIVHPQDAMLRFLVLVCSNSTVSEKSHFLYTGYPLLQAGSDAVVSLREIKEQEMPHEAIIEAEPSSGSIIWFFDPFYFLNREKYKVGETLKISLSGLAYIVREATTESIKVESGAMLEMERQRALEDDPTVDPESIKFVEISIKDSCWLMPQENAGDSEFRGIVEESTFFEVMGLNFCRMLLTVMRIEDGDDGLKLAIFASESVLNDYRPEVGDRVEGVAWIQGYPADSAG